MANRSKGRSKVRYGGYDETFVDVVPERLTCNICYKLLRNPHLMVCCGQKYCHSCLNVWFKKLKKETCPHCRAIAHSQREVLHVLDRGAKGEVESLFTLCHHYREGCEWVGELKNLKPHLKSCCDYALVECPNHCYTTLETKTRLRRMDLDSHLTDCQPRVLRVDVHHERSKIVADLTKLLSCFSCEY